ncbi:MAG: hypothetical protein ACM30H_01745 [Clostridia bacterium]
MKTALAALALAAGALTASSAFAWGHHGGGRVFLGFNFGVPVYAPYYYYPGPVYYPAPVVVQQQPMVYSERSDLAAAPAAPQENYWYYCAASRGYYPYVQECPSGWQRVPAAPAR